MMKIYPIRKRRAYAYPPKTFLAPILRKSYFFIFYRQTAPNTNMNADNVIKTIIIKSHFIGEDEVHKAGRPFLQQQAVIEKNAISLAAQHVSAADRTILTKAFIEKNKVRKLSAPIIDN